MEVSRRVNSESTFFARLADELFIELSILVHWRGLAASFFFFRANAITVFPVVVFFSFSFFAGVFIDWLNRCLLR